jgi:hypothetical protein
LWLLEVVTEALVEVVDVTAGLADTRLAVVGDVRASWAGDTLAVQSARSKSWAFALSGLTLTLGLSTVDITSAAPGLGGLVNVSSLGASIRLAEVTLEAATLRALAFLVRVLKLAVLASAGIRFAICTLDEIGIAGAEGDTLAGVGVRNIALDTLALLLGVFTNELSLLVVADTAAATLEGRFFNTNRHAELSMRLGLLGTLALIVAVLEVLVVTLAGLGCLVGLGSVGRVLRALGLAKIANGLVALVAALAGECFSILILDGLLTIGALGLARFAIPELVV